MSFRLGQHLVNDLTHGPRESDRDCVPNLQADLRLRATEDVSVWEILQNG